MQPFDAAILLFGESVDLQRVTPADVKSAFRRRVHMLHPDATRGASQHCGAAVSSLVSARDTLVEHLHAPQKKAVGPTPIKHSNTASSSARTGYPFTIVKPSRPAVEKLPRKAHERYYTGVFPTYKLKFGQFLYFSGEISWQDLVRGMRWQRDQRPPYGEIAKAWGWLTDKDIRAVRAATEIPGVFGEKAVALGLLTEKQAAFLVRHQHHSQPRLGEFFVKTMVLLPNEVTRLLKVMERHNASIKRG
jgi:hypothetical protein